mmetsp:Transcript_12037/g.26284  ORF Transcript_12037/g.26284 Transcript_12037/m.26284 type:complete len:111 (-) Transcript_12037:218-550(-)
MQGNKLHKPAILNAGRRPTDSADQEKSLVERMIPTPKLACVKLIASAGCCGSERVSATKAAMYKQPAGTPCATTAATKQERHAEFNVDGSEKLVTYKTELRTEIVRSEFE